MMVLTGYQLAAIALAIHQPKMMRQALFCQIIIPILPSLYSYLRLNSRGVDIQLAAVAAEQSHSDHETNPRRQFGAPPARPAAAPVQSRDPFLLLPRHPGCYRVFFPLPFSFVPSSFPGVVGVAIACSSPVLLRPPCPCASIFCCSPSLLAPAFHRQLAPISEGACSTSMPTTDIFCY
uniref:Uncharacterized protein n=1 Tax=Setaria viridis TaxID=4556 RepID=A0A4U6V473_SETVI|nr:hypothetical protein SEVIR_3G015150v2 [Setaria viridis]